MKPQDGSLRRYLQKARWAAGEPSLRTIAAAIGLSHTTVTLVMNGNYATSWASVQKVSDYLKLDREETRALWVAQRAEDADRLRRLPPGQASEVGQLLETTNSLLRSILERLNDIAVAVRPTPTSGGVLLADDVLDAAAEEAERGYDLSQVRPRSERGQG